MPLQRRKPYLQWHPAFYAGIQIELEGEAENLIFENEHQLGTKPKEIDVLIIKKNPAVQIQKNIGQIFRKHNIIEYKSPEDYVSIDDFYRTYGYACFYKADRGREDAVIIDEITITFVCYHFPQKLINHLQTERNYSMIRTEKGIYHIKGDKIPIQLVIVPKLSAEENLWLKSLTDDLREEQIRTELLPAYRGHKDSHLYQSVMDMIVRANREKFEEVKDMCKALEELMQEELEEMKESGKQEGESRVNCLNRFLVRENRIEDILKAASDRAYQQKLFEEFAL